jgi:hypothetical protein
MEKPTANSAPQPDLASLARLWPNRTHESNWLKDAICALGFHRWYLLDGTNSGSIVKCSFCRWCTKVKLRTAERA